MSFTIPEHKYLYDAKQDYIPVMHNNWSRLMDNFQKQKSQYQRLRSAVISARGKCKKLESRPEERSLENS